MKQKVLLLVFTLTIALISYSQSFTSFRFTNDYILFNSVEMKVTEGKTNNKVFEGFKESEISIFSYGGKPSTISLKLSGYLKIENAGIQNIETKEDEIGKFTVTFKISDATAMAYVILYYKDADDANQGDPTMILVSGTASIKNKQAKILSFTLKGITTVAEKEEK